MLVHTLCLQCPDMICQTHCCLQALNLLSLSSSTSLANAYNIMMLFGEYDVLYHTCRVGVVLVCSWAWCMSNASCLMVCSLVVISVISDDHTQ